MSNPTQKILFGPPGCGKSYKVRQEAEVLGITDPRSNPNMIETTFHPEYGYGDFVAKLMPITKGGTIEYRVHAGPLIKALARAYDNLKEKDNPDKKVLLVIDEINRGNCAQIFGDIFQLLDRNDAGWSEYGLDPSDLIETALEDALKRPKEELHSLNEELNAKGKLKLRLPPNLSIIGTMNTSDESVYYMDTAFKRRWEFEHMPWEGARHEKAVKQHGNAMIQGKYTWNRFADKLNAYIATEFNGRSVDDKQIGIWFLRSKHKNENIRTLLGKLSHLTGKHKLTEWNSVFGEFFAPYTADGHDERLKCLSVQAVLKEKYGLDDFSDAEFNRPPSDLAQHLIDKITKTSPVVIPNDAIRNKLMFFLWDNVFSRNRTTLHDLLRTANPEAKKPLTFGEFSEQVDTFIEAVMAYDATAKQ